MASMNELKKVGVLGAGMMGADQVCPPQCLLASNTSSIPITRLAACLSQERRPNFLGAHFFSPASVMKLVEVIPGLETGEQAIEAMIQACRRIGKAPIRVKDVPGFAVNRLLHAMWIEANRLVEEGVASVEDMDTACRLGLGHPVGPYALMDLTSNDLNLWVQEILFEAYGERFRPRPLLKQKVHARHLGRKTGRACTITPRGLRARFVALAFTPRRFGKGPWPLPGLCKVEELVDLPGMGGGSIMKQHLENLYC